MENQIHLKEILEDSDISPWKLPANNFVLKCRGHSSPPATTGLNQHLDAQITLKNRLLLHLEYDLNDLIDIFPQSSRIRSCTNLLTWPFVSPKNTTWDAQFVNRPHLLTQNFPAFLSMADAWLSKGNFKFPTKCCRASGFPKYTPKAQQLYPV